MFKEIVFRVSDVSSGGNCDGGGGGVCVWGCVFRGFLGRATIFTHKKGTLVFEGNSLFSVTGQESC